MHGHIKMAEINFVKIEKYKDDSISMPMVKHEYIL